MIYDMNAYEWLDRSPGDLLRRVNDAIRELDRMDAGLGPSRPGHSLRDAAHGLRPVRDELREIMEAGVE